MALALVLALMMAAAVMAVLWPLARAHPAAAAANDANDVAVYRDQLDEIERDRAGGAISPAEADAARIEVSRRMIAAADRAARAPAADDPGVRLRHRRVAAVAALVLMPAAAAALYLPLGAPGLPAQPLSARLSSPPDIKSVDGLVARVEAHLDSNPGDGRGWEVLAPVYMRQGRFDDAVRADRNVLRLLGDSAAREADLGEALIAAANGVVTAEAKAVFERAASLDGEDARAQFYLGLAADQDGRRHDAGRIWQELIAKAPPNASWLPVVREALARLDAPADVAGRPSAEDIAAAAEMPPAERDLMVRGMVDRLATRLHQDGSDVDGWLRLMRAYKVLGERDKARAAATDARKALQNDPEKLRRLDSGAKDIGIEG